MPMNIARVVERAIAARKRCAEWFNATDSQNKSNLGHQHFIRVLERSLFLIRSCVKLDVRGALGKNKTVSQPSSHAIETTNRFDVLKVDHLEHTLDDTDDKAHIQERGSDAPRTLHFDRQFAA